MKTYVQPGDVVTLPAPYNVVSGAGLQVGQIFGVACYDAASGADVEAMTEGVFDLAKTGSQAWAVGDLVYWDDTSKSCTTVATGNLLIGSALLAVTGAAGNTTGRVRLNGVAAAAAA